MQPILPDQLEHDDRLIEQLRCRMGYCTDQRMEMAFPGPTLWQSKPSIRACSCTALSSTDDIQMMLFTAEGLLRAYVRNSARGICHVPSVIHHALLR